MRIFLEIRRQGDGDASSAVRILSLRQKRRHGIMDARSEAAFRRRALPQKSVCGVAFLSQPLQGADSGGKAEGKEVRIENQKICRRIAAE